MVYDNPNENHSILTGKGLQLKVISDDHESHAAALKRDSNLSATTTKCRGRIWNVDVSRAEAGIISWVRCSAGPSLDPVTSDMILGLCSPHWLWYDILTYPPVSSNIPEHPWTTWRCIAQIIKVNDGISWVFQFASHVWYPKGLVTLVMLCHYPTWQK